MTDESLKTFARDAAARTPDSAQLLTALVDRIEELEAECFKLSAGMCHDGYGDDFGNWRCKYQDRIEELEAALRNKTPNMLGNIAMREAVAAERERWKQHVKNAYNEGFKEGMNETTRHIHGGKSFEESKIAAAIRETDDD